MSWPIATIGIIIFTVYGSYRGFQSPSFQRRYTFSTGRVLQGKEYYRLISSGFLHANWLHLMLNMLALNGFARMIELAFGPHVFLLIYLGSIAGGNLLSLYLYRHREYQSLGASGGVSGVIFATIFLFPGGKISPFFGLLAMPTWLYGILFLLLSFFALRRQLGNIGHSAHLGGAIVGLLITTALYPSIVMHSPVLYVLVMGISIALLVYLYRYPLYRPPPPIFSWAYWRAWWAERQRRRAAEQERQDQETMNRLLDKISRSGMESLTASEKRALKAISKRMRESGRMH
ncbi:MAG TPA: rhomboid family intramembrane serine protease [Chloroflexi bacterium]|nr:rhomboid family intramembrane serine protease [Chloroflexota bacterium]